MTPNGGNRTLKPSGDNRTAASLPDGLRRREAWPGDPPAAKEHDLFKTYVRALEADLNKAGDEIHRLREALSFYSADKNWRTHRTPTGEAPSDAEVDRGKVARDALA